MEDEPRANDRSSGWIGAPDILDIVGEVLGMVSRKIKRHLYFPEYPHAKASYKHYGGYMENRPSLHSPIVIAVPRLTLGISGFCFMTKQVKSPV